MPQPFVSVRHYLILIAKGLPKNRNISRAAFFGRRLVSVGESVESAQKHREHTCSKVWMTSLPKKTIRNVENVQFCQEQLGSLKKEICKQVVWNNLTRVAWQKLPSRSLLLQLFHCPPLRHQATNIGWHCTGNSTGLVLLLLGLIWCRSTPRYQGLI